MPRNARVRSKSKIYHVIVRGVNRQDIFSDDVDREKFLQILYECKELSGFELYGYCLMTNHVHLLIKEGAETVSQIMRRIGTRYVQFFNWKHNRIGHLFQDRFKSEAVTDDRYFLTVLRYIHHNPLQAGMVKRLNKYGWSSFSDYTHNGGITDTDFGRSLLQGIDIEEYMSEDSNDKCLDMDEKVRHITDDELRNVIMERYHLRPLQIAELLAEQRNEILRTILDNEHANTRQLARVTGISNNTIWKLGKEA
jgi:REP element-mobilizing transposase RayT